MNRALWKKAVSDAWLQLALSSVLLALFGWVFVWLHSQFKVAALLSLFNLLPDFVQQLIGIPLDQLATPVGRLSFLYTHLIPLLICIGWAIGRGSDVVSGGIARGTLELILTLPVRRVSVLATQAIVATLGAAILAASLWLGNWLGLATVGVEGDVAIGQLLPAVVNLFAMTVCLTGVTTFLSSFDRDRWRTMWLAGALFVVSAILKMIGRLWQRGAWLKYCSFLSAFEPQRLVLLGEDTRSLSFEYNATLLGIGLIGYVAAALVFSWRDIPVPR